MRGKWESNFEFDQFDLDQFDHASLTTKQGKCGKSRLVTTSATKHFIAKVGYFYPKSGVLLGASTYVIILSDPFLKEGRE